MSYERLTVANDRSRGKNPWQCLWLSVAFTAIHDAWADTRFERRKGKPGVEFGRAQAYFESRDWRELCDLAGLHIPADAVMRWLETATNPSFKVPEARRAAA